MPNLTNLTLKKLAIFCCVCLFSFGLASPLLATENNQQTTALAAAQRLNINEANAEQLASLPGIGPSKAEAILTNREANGRFNSLDDLQRVKGIGAKTAERLAPLVSF